MATIRAYAELGISAIVAMVRNPLRQTAGRRKGWVLARGAGPSSPATLAPVPRRGAPLPQPPARRLRTASARTLMSTEHTTMDTSEIPATGTPA